MIETLFAENLNQEVISADQRAVLRASLSLFSAKGFERTSMADIARMAGMSEKSVHYSFETKELILAEILTPISQKVIPEVADEFIQELEDGNLVSFKMFLEYLVANRLQFYNDNRLQIKILIQQLNYNTSLFEYLVTHLSKQLIDNFDQIFQKYQKNNELVLWPSDRIIRYIISTMVSYIIPKVLAGKNDAVNVSRATSESVDFLLRGLRP